MGFRNYGKVAQKCLMLLKLVGHTKLESSNITDSILS